MMTDLGRWFGDGVIGNVIANVQAKAHSLIHEMYEPHCFPDVS
ncbi:hypothetical protein [Celerinatantimonas sp. YJH-8]